MVEAIGHPLGLVLPTSKRSRYSPLLRSFTASSNVNRTIWGTVSGAKPPVWGFMWRLTVSHGCADVCFVSYVHMVYMVWLELKIVHSVKGVVEDTCNVECNVSYIKERKFKKCIFLCKWFFVTKVARTEFAVYETVYNCCGRLCEWDTSVCESNL